VLVERGGDVKVRRMRLGRLTNPKLTVGVELAQPDEYDRVEELLEEIRGISKI
jgi:hypothetical protein